MKNALFMAMAAILITGCASMKKQMNINKVMETHVFEAPAADVYEAAEAEFKGMYTPINSTGKTTGASEWITRPTELGGKKYKEKSRFTVTVTPKGKKMSMVVVSRESATDITGKWGDTRKARMGVYEFNILKRLDSAKAQEVEAKAAAME